MPIDPRISLGIQPIQVADPVARYGQLATIQNAQNQNALAQLQLATAQREQESVNALNEAYAKAYDPTTGKINNNLLRETIAKSGFGSKLPALEKTLSEIEKQRLEAEKLQGEVTAQPTTLEKNKADLLDAKLKQSRAFLDTLDPADPNAPAKYIAWHEANHKDPIIGPALAARGITADQSRAQIEAAIAQGPQAFADLVNRSKLGTEKFMEINKPEFEFKEITNPDGTIGVQAINKRTAVAQPVMSNGQIISSPNIPAQRLQFEKDKLAWEQANPGKEIKEVTNADGTVSVFGIDKRTGVATPVTMAAPNQPAPAPAPGQPLVGAKVNAPPSMVAEYTFAKTPEGGSFKGSFQQFVTARAAASRAPAPAVAPTITQIVDPTNPNQMITIDAKRYQGGGAGSPGVIGVAGKEPSAALRVNKIEQGKTQLADDLENLRASFETLNKLRAVPSTERGPLSNVTSAIAASRVGQLTGQAFATEAQVERDVINSARTRLVNSIKNATGMSAQQLNSNVELQTMLKSISDPGQSYQSALRIIEDIEKAYVTGNGTLPKKDKSGGARAAAPAVAPNIDALLNKYK